MRRFVLVAVLVLTAATWSFGAQLIINFTEPTSKRTSIFNDMQNANTGANGMEVIAGPKQYHMDGLLWCDLSALAGKTINSATLHLAQDGWGWSGLDNVSVRRFTSTQNWLPGTGAWNNRWTNDNGAGVRMADWYDESGVGSGHDWAGTLFTYLSGTAPYTNYVDSFVYDCDTIPPGTAGVDFNMTALVQQWADGTFANNGWVMSAQNAISSTSAHLSRPTLTIDFTTPIPEPASVILFGTGAAAVLHWRRRRK